MYQDILSHGCQEYGTNNVATEVPVCFPLPKQSLGMFYSPFHHHMLSILEIHVP